MLNESCFFDIELTERHGAGRISEVSFYPRGIAESLIPRITSKERIAAESLLRQYAQSLNHQG